MTFIEADAKLSEMFPGKYRYVQFQVTRTSGGEIKEIDCQLYVDGKDIYRGPTFEKAFSRLKGEIEPLPEAEGITDERP